MYTRKKKKSGVCELLLNYAIFYAIICNNYLILLIQ